jgi:hypothetical protein
LGYVTHRRAALLIPVGVIVAAVKHHHRELAAAPRSTALQAMRPPI